MLADRIKNLEPSPTIALDARVRELMRQGKIIINLGVGEPNFSTPKYICDAAIDAINSGFTHYTPAGGIPELRAVIAKYSREKLNLNYSADEIIVGAGSKSLLYNIFQILCNPGDEVLTPTPTWGTYFELIKLSGATPVEVSLAPPFKLTADDLRKKITPKTKVILLNFPSNPTGAIIKKTELKKIGDLAIEKNLYIISDEIYGQMTYANPHPTLSTVVERGCVSIASLGDEIKKRTITVNGFSKSFAMTGWRVGWGGGPREIIDALIALQGQTTFANSSISQRAALAALNGGKIELQEMMAELRARRDFITTELTKIDGLEWAIPEGAFYFFVSVKKLLSKKYPTSAAWCEGMLGKEGVAVVPGEAFHAPGYFRLSYGAAMEEVKKGVRGIANFIQS
ncbi:MAG: pyridoxal phosphate-dependent aminotransferase [Patescibacteria group bacterium]